MRFLLAVIFWVWAAFGFLYSALQILDAHGRSELGVGTSAAVMMDILFWIGGLLMFGLGASLTKEEIPQLLRPLHDAEKSRL